MGYMDPWRAGQGACCMECKSSWCPALAVSSETPFGNEKKRVVDAEDGSAQRSR